MTHRRYIYIETLHFGWLNISLIGYIMIYHKNHRIEVPICSYQASPSLPLWLDPSSRYAAPIRARAPHGALALAAEVVDGILGPAGTKCRFCCFCFSGDEKKPPEKCHVDVAFKNVSGHFSDPQVIHGILSCYRTRKNSADCMSLGRKKIAAHIQMVHC